MLENNGMMKQDQGQEKTADTPNAMSEKIRYGAPDGPRKKRRTKYDGHEPLEYPGHEAVAQHLVAPESLREFKSYSDLANHFHVSRMTIHRWKNDVDVIQRAHWLSTHNKIAGDLIVRCAWPQIMKKLVDSALRGNVAAIKYCGVRAWPEDKQGERSGLSGMSLEEFVALSEEEEKEHALPHWASITEEDEATEGMADVESSASEGSQGTPE